MRFVHDTLPQRVRFATGEAAEHLAQEVRNLGATRLMVIASRPQRVVAERLVTDLPVAIWHHDIAMHVPRPVAERTCHIAALHAVDCLVSVGGGSTTGLAKAVALKTALPIIAVPTTYAGSEATPVWGMTEDDHKQTGADPRALPRAVIYDASLSRSLPVDISVASGLNALAHSIDSLWGPRANPVNATLAAEGIRALAIGLPSVKAEPDDLAAREQTLYGAYLAATAFASAGAGLHHKICHVLGGMFGLPHAQTHAIVLPHVLALNAPHAEDAERRIAAALGAPTAEGGLRHFRERLDPPVALRDHGMPANAIIPAAEAVLAEAPPQNPARLSTDNLTALLRAAWEGRLP
ncbi:maleylacetate reductase [Pseudonocardia sp. NPDC049154]|uniref:maleylacetate reductase n=1 Tax=Pseudonocardia sp. NPDC049154 TaxID=3155501 RepID=UPI0033E8DA3E